MNCQTCSHPQRQAINLALLTGNHTFEALSKIYRLSISSLFRHKKHLVEKMHQARQRLRDSQQQGCLFKLNTILDHVQKAVQTAETEGNVDQVLKGAQVGSQLIRQIGQMEVPLELDTVYRLISSPLWGTRDSILPTESNIITGIHQSLAEAALFPCPDPPPENLPDEDEDDEYDDETDDDGEAEAVEDSPIFPETGNEQPETVSLETQTMLQNLITATGASPLANFINAETASKFKREISAKLPKNIFSCAENISQNQLDKRCQKNLARNPGVGRESAAPPAILLKSETPPAIAVAIKAAPSVQPETGNQQPETIVLGTRNSELETPPPPPTYHPLDDCIVPLRNERFYRPGIF